tara:strand:+ start:1947 stop:2084 length:138 start_codon:yes stop_codon:yes gene_type:complete
MKGAIAELSEKIINNPNNNIIIIIGANQNFFLTYKNSNNSNKNFI